MKVERIKGVEFMDTERNTSTDFTEREMSVLWCVMQGMTNGDIGKTLCISLSTVKFHLANLYQKTKTRSRTELTHKILLSLINRPLNFEIFRKLIGVKSQ